ncbi:MAG: type II toxin-antitoxin system RelE/ParE family toxin [Candidatus Competibacteraceae bacterium]
MQIKWLRTALRNLDAEAEYIARDNPAAADRMVQKIRATVNLLIEQPALGRAGRVPNTRELVIGGTPYLVPYRVRGQVIEVLRVLHAARQWPPQF